MRISVVGAGVMGTWTAYHLLKAGHQVTLYESVYPGHTRSSSGGESRLIRGIYGRDEIYMDWVHYALESWKQLQQEAGSQLFYPAGCLWMFGRDTEYGDYAYQYLQKINWPIHQMDLEVVRKTYPQISLEDVEKVYFEPESGYLMARLGCQLIKALFVKNGGVYRQQKVEIEEAQLSKPDFALDPANPHDILVMACGPWLKNLLPGLLGNSLMISRQEIYYFTPPTQANAYSSDHLPSWIDLSVGNFYGIPVTQQRGFKLADDTRTEALDIDSTDRIPGADRITKIKSYLRKRFPGLAGAILSEARVCQYTNTPDGNFILDYYPENQRIILAGGGSGHAYKLGPAIARHIYDLIIGKQQPIPMFSLERLNENSEFKSQFKRKNSFY